ncbi:rhodanese-like domain-containing protein [Cohnella hongkongensis]|uniref:Rhodanese-like domain-containing protein n=1 Tax=Cohnella hongkongensis TaxID=178337 RepID=A0ABV9FGW4_9BACL
MKWLLLLMIIPVIYELRNQWPVKGLHYIDYAELSLIKGSNQFKWVDIRESPDYYKNHLEDSIHIFLGRLPFVWANHIQPGDKIVLLGRNRRSINIAARILGTKAGVNPKIFAYVL